MTTYCKRILFLLLCVQVMVFVNLYAGGQGRYTNRKGYAFYDIWWFEQQADRETTLMLHFNSPSEPEWMQPGNEALAAQESEKEDSLEESLAEMQDDGPEMDDMGMRNQTERSLEVKDGRPTHEVAPEGVIYDYSPNVREFKITEGVRKVENGRFGKALEFDGSNGLEIRLGKKGKRHSMDAWIKVDQLPEETACIFASPYFNDMGGRLLLEPDGHLTFEWASQNKRDSASGGIRKLRSDVPIEAGAWTHVAAYTFQSVHIEVAYRRSDFYEMRIGINGRLAAFEDRGRGALKGNNEEFINPEKFYIGMNPEGEQVFQGLMDEVRVMGPRRYNNPRELAVKDEEELEKISFGPPDFQADQRVFHADFDSPELAVHPEDKNTLSWDLGDSIQFADMQIPGVAGKGLLIDSALPLPRIPIQGMSTKEGTFEFWFQPANWDNHTNYAEKTSFLNRHRFSILRFFGRHKDTGNVVPFMELFMFPVTIHGDADWFHPGQWYHLIFSWSPEDVHKESAWGSVAGKPESTFRAYRFGDSVWRVYLRRDADLISKVEPLYLELGIADQSREVYQGQRPAIMVDEVIGHANAFSDDEKKRAPLRWLKRLPDPKTISGTQCYVGKATPSYK